MPKFKVTATMDVAYETYIEAADEETAWSLAQEHDTNWEKVDDGHDFTIEQVWEITGGDKYV